MLLKRVSVCGFKSFCDKVDFDFSAGVTCIVGPNGCGKSNVVDAFKWVLGEQSARSLRGRQMLDMIFNGSSARRASSLAQVDLVFDNTDRTLPMDTDEVTVTRRLYRSGESEYQLNRETVRLKDIRELFMDTGIGGDSYSVIEQGRVDSLLQSSPQERRAIFEEAAGISKCRARKREAQRKLERTDQNLLRVDDIIDEVQKRLRSVKLQAGKARNYREYEGRLNELRSSYALAEYHRFSETIARLTRETERHSDNATQQRTQINHLEAQETERTARLDKLADDISAVDNRLVNVRSEIATQEERIAGAGQRIEEQEAQRQRTQERRANDHKKLQQSEEELHAACAAAESWQRQITETQAQLERLAEQERGLARDGTQAQAILEDEKAGLVDLLRRSAQTHNEIIRLNTHHESLEGQKGRLHQRDALIASELEESLQRKAGLERRLAEVEELIAAETKALEEKRAEATRIGALCTELAAELGKSKEERSALHSRQELLQDLERRMEGVGAGVRTLLEAKRQAPEDPALARIHGLVADAFETDVSHAPIIEAALGEADQTLVATESATLLSRLDLVGELPGRLTVLGLDRLPPVVNERDFSEQPGFVARALDLVRYDERFEQLARHLFGKTVVVETLAAAISLAREDVHGHRFVTLASELVEPDGRVSVGPPDTRAGLISRRSELKDIEVQVAILNERVDRLIDQLNRNQAEASHLESVQQELRTAIYESNTARIEATAALQGIAETVRRLTQEQPLIAHEVAQLEHQLAELQQQSAEGDKSLVALEQENEQRKLRVSAHQERIDVLVTQRRQMQEKLTELRVQVGQLAEKRSAALETVAVLQRGIQSLQEARAEAAGEIEQCARRIDEAHEAQRGGRDQLARLTVTASELQEEGNRLRHEREAYRAELESFADQLKATRHALEAAEAELHRAQMALTETNVRRDELSARVREELSIDLRTQYESYEHSDQDWEEVEAEIAELKGKIARLGNVNLDAIQELEELEERNGFLTEQRDDLHASKRQLEELIVRLDAEAAQRFLETFENIRDHFRALFRKLFGGGRADVVLENPEDLLESGIEIMAQPPGKELQSISLMSGGEKSLTAIALVMSMFMSRPAPFAILDEVDAALDEANNVRFNQIVQEFITHAQFIVVTHSKRTMSIAEQLYGITMQEPGVSTRVSVQFADTHVA